MSHATVLVIGEDIESQLAPYDENIRTEPRLEKVTIDPESWPGSFVAKEAPTVDLLDPFQVATWLNDRWTDEESSYVAQPDGVYEWTTYNPLSKWDWYVVGGRWRGMLLLKPGCKGELGKPGSFDNEPMHAGGVDRARKGDIDWDLMRAAALVDVEKRWATYEKELIKNPSHAGFLYGIREGDTREKWQAEALTTFPLSTHAVVAEGVWREVGRLGWFGTSTDDESDRLSWAEWYQFFMEGLPDQALLTICDYHI